MDKSLQMTKNETKNSKTKQNMFRYSCFNYLVAYTLFPFSSPFFFTFNLLCILLKSAN